MTKNFGNMRSVAVLALAFFLVPQAAQAQSALDVLNRILGRKTASGSSTTPVSSPKPSRPGSPSIGPQVVRATPGAVGYLDYSLAWRFHPLCRSLHIDKDQTRKPLWVKPEEVQPLVSPKKFVAERRKQREKQTKALERLRYRHRLAQKNFNSYPASAAEALSKLPKNTPAPRRKAAEEKYFAEVTRRKSEVRRLADAIHHTSSQRTESMDRSSSLREFYAQVIKKDLDQALDAELGQRQLAIVLNVPWQQAAPPSERLYTKAPRHESNLNSLNHFFDAPAVNAGDQDIAGKYLGRWMDQSWVHRQAFPAQVHSLGVVKGGVEITSSVVERIWRKYKIDAVRIQILRTFLIGNKGTFLQDMN